MVAEISERPIIADHAAGNVVKSGLQSKPEEQSRFNPRNMFALLLAVVLTGGLWVLLAEMNDRARLSIIIFALTLIGWIFTNLEETWVALIALVASILLGVIEPGGFFSSLGSPTIWLLIASFIVAAAVSSTGLAFRLTNRILRKVGTVYGLFFSLTLIIASTAFMIPSTTGRAALLLPVFLSLKNVIESRRVKIALSLLFPSIVLLSAICSLTGAAAHLVTVQILADLTGAKITFTDWLLVGLPFGLVSCAITTVVILFLFLSKDERNGRIDTRTVGEESDSANSKPWKREEITIALVLVLMLAGWLTESIHGINTALIAVAGALIVSAPKVGNLKLNQALREVDWSLLVFMAATLKLGESLIETGGAGWLFEAAFSQGSGFSINERSWEIVAVVVLVSLGSHLVINSRTARSSVLIPLVIILAGSVGANPAALAFISTAAAGFCLTLTVSAKPVLVFSRLGDDTFSQSDLLKLSGVLLPVHLIILTLFALFVFPSLGLRLT